MADDDILGGAAKGAATGATAGGPWGALAGAGIGALSPFIAKGLGSLFGLDQPSAEEQAAMGQLRSVAQGAQTPAQIMLAAQRAKTAQQLASLASRGTAQQQAGQTRMAMQMAPEIQAQQAAQLAAMRAQEQRSAQEALAALQTNIGARTRQYERGLVGAGLQGGMAMAANTFLGGGGGGAAGAGAADAAASGAADAALKNKLGISGSSYGGEAAPDYAKELGFSQAAPASAMTPTQASNLQTAFQQAKAPMAPTATPGEASYYSGPAIPKWTPSAQQEADSEMYYRGLTGGAGGQAAAGKYFASTNTPTTTVDIPAGAESRGSFGARQNAYDFNKGNVERQVGALPKSLGAKPVQYTPAAPSEVTQLGRQVSENQGINAAIGNQPGPTIGVPMRRKLGFGYGY